MKKIAFLTFLLVALCGSVNAQSKQKELPSDAKTAQISIPGYCCKGLNSTIETTLAYERGVISWTLSPEQKNVTVLYRSTKTTPDKIEKALSENGVRPEHYAANPRAIKDLPKCCQPAARGQESNCNH